MNDTLDLASMEANAVHQSHENQELNKAADEQQIIDTIYSHYGRPENIVQEKFRLYTNYSTPAGYEVPSWNDGGWQRGRLTVYVSYDKENDGSFYTATKIPDEGEGSWFFHTDGKVLKVFVNGQVDILEILEAS